jgi:hypothetical protein
MILEIHHRDNKYHKYPLTESQGILGEHQGLRIATSAFCVDIEETPDGRLKITCMDGLTAVSWGGQHVVLLEKTSPLVRFGDNDG